MNIDQLRALNLRYHKDDVVVDILGKTYYLQGQHCIRKDLSCCLCGVFPDTTKHKCGLVCLNKFDIQLHYKYNRTLVCLCCLADTVNITFIKSDSNPFNELLVKRGLEYHVAIQLRQPKKSKHMTFKESAYNYIKNMPMYMLLMNTNILIQPHFEKLMLVTEILARHYLCDLRAAIVYGYLGVNVR